MTAPRLMIAALVVSACAACTASVRDDHNADAPAGGAGHVAAAATEPGTALPDTAAREPGALRLVRAERVQARVGPDGAPFEVAVRIGAVVPDARRFGTRTLPIALRTDEPLLGQYPCASCHAGGRLQPGAARSPDAHANTPAAHPRELRGGCSTCHAVDDVARLDAGTDERVTFDHAYRVCARCHFSQTDAWAAGAHGKRLDGWQGRRVVLGCTACHDPHEPALQRRTPFRPPQLHRAEAQRP